MSNRLHFNPTFIQTILEHTDLYVLVSEKVKLQKRAKDFVGLCPFHSEKTPSFYVIPDKQFYHCFGCGKSGNAITWLKETGGLGVSEAIAELARRAGITLPRMKSRRTSDQLTGQASEAEIIESEMAELEKINRSYELMEKITLAFSEALSRARHAIEYLKSRNVSDSAKESFRLGYCPSDWSILSWAKSNGFTRAELSEQGLINSNDRARFHSRLIFPISDARGRVIAFGGRLMAETSSTGGPKYINSRETSLFDKKKTLYNLHRAREASYRGEETLLVEGYLDCIAASQAGFEGALALMGTALSEEGLRQLWRFCPRPTIVFDGDRAGKAAADRLLINALPMLAPERTLKFVSMPPMNDPADFLNTNGVTAFKRLIDTAETCLDRIWSVAVPPGQNTNADDRAAFRSRLDELTSKIDNSYIKQEYRRENNLRVFGPRTKRPHNRSSGASRYQPQRVSSGKRGASLRSPEMSKTSQGSLSGFWKDRPADRSVLSAEVLNAQIVCYCLLCYPELLNENLEELSELRLPEVQQRHLQLLLEAAAEQHALDKLSLVSYIQSYMRTCALKESGRKSDLLGFHQDVIENRALKRLAPFKADGDLGAARELLRSVINQNWEQRLTREIDRTAAGETMTLVEVLRAREAIREGREGLLNNSTQGSEVRHPESKTP